MSELNDKQKKVLFDMLEDLQSATHGDNYHQTITKSEFMDHAHYVKEAFGYDYIAEKERIKAEEVERIENEPSDFDITIRRANKNY